ncbi:MAG: helix-turn-helix domain-containing protein [Deltaproteobacteria bacterium]|nr:helix-turn-helix domain-containing protein [Deltaproteobacteria bacterium]
MTGALEQSCLHWRSDALPARHRFEAWESALNQSHLPWRLNKGSSGDFQASLGVARLHDLQLVDCVCDPCSGLREGHELGADSQAWFGLLVLFEGAEQVQVGARTAELFPGQVLLWDSTVPIRFRLQAPIHKLTVFVPQDRLLAVAPQASSLVGSALDWRHGMGAVVSAHVAALCAQAPYIAPERVPAAAETTLHLVAASLDTKSAEPAAHTQLLGRIKAWLEAHLEDPELGPPAIAARFGISLRYLHQLFSHEETTVSRWLLARRLQRCREALVMEPHLGVSEIAYRWGFNDAAHFSRVFRRNFGCSPRDYRRHLLA